MRRDQDGSIAPLLIGLAAVLAILITVVVDASAGYLGRQGLNSVADAAALAATDGVQAEAAYTHGLDAQVEIDLSAARRFVAGYLASVAADRRYQDLTWSVTVHDRAVTVRLGAELPLPLHLPGMQARAAIAGSSAAVLEVGRR